MIAPLHRVGVVHGDIKPGNAIIDARGAAHVIDFGLARVTGQGQREQPAGGTLPFMAPELLRGEPPSVQSRRVRARRHALAAAHRRVSVRARRLPRG